MTEKEQQKKKPAKYNDAETKKPGSPIETPYKHGDVRIKKHGVVEPVIKLKSNIESKAVETDE